MTKLRIKSKRKTNKGNKRASMFIDVSERIKRLLIQEYGGVQEREEKEAGSSMREIGIRVIKEEKIEG